MKKTTILITACFVITVLVISCSKTSEDKLGTDTPVTTCDTVNMAYTADVVPILQANCYSCHGNGGNSGGVNLDTYDNVKIVADNGSLLGAITHASGFVPMPLNAPQLSDCDINKIKSWIGNGAQNN